MIFVWDQKKNDLNFEKHGVWFEEAQTLWASSTAVEFYDSEHSDFREDRYIRIGFSTRLNLLVVIFCENSNGSTIRILSARHATTQEERQFEERI